MPVENGIFYAPKDPDKRGRHRTAASAFDAALRDLLAERNPFFDLVADRWPTLFPALPMKPGRADGGVIYLYVRTASLSYMMRPRLPMVHKALSALPGAPRRFALRLEVHAS